MKPNHHKLRARHASLLGYLKRDVHHSASCWEISNPTRCFDMVTVKFKSGVGIAAMTLRWRLLEALERDGKWFMCGEEDHKVTVSLGDFE